MEINLTEQEALEAKKLAQRLKTQDPRGTALPIFFLLQDIEEKRAFDCGDFLLFNDENGEIWRGDDEDDIVRQILEERKQEIDFELEESEEEIDKKIAELESEIYDEVSGQCYEMNYEFVTKRIFLTEEAANNHLKLNKHHYSDKARIYVDHAWRDPEMELVYKILTSINND